MPPATVRVGWDPNQAYTNVAKCSLSPLVQIMLLPWLVIGSTFWALLCAYLSPTVTSSHLVRWHY
jgi:hypothetical protein